MNGGIPLTTKFQEALAAGEFVSSVELDPPKGVDLGPLKELAKELSGRVHAVVISDNQAAEVRMAPLAVARLCLDQGCEVVMTLACRDRNRLALTSDLLAAWALGVRNLLLVSGDFVSLGDHPQAKPVYDLDSVQALGLVAELAAGRDLAGGELAGAPEFFAGAALAPRAEPLALQLMKARKKLRAGAGFLITQPLEQAAQLAALDELSGAGGAPLLAGVEAGGPGERESAAALAAEIKSGGLAAGVHLSMPAAQEGLPELLDLCGL